MDILSMILSRNQGGKPLAKTETKKITWDGNTEGRESFVLPDTELSFVKISDDVPNYKSVTLVELYGIRFSDSDGNSEGSFAIFAGNNLVWQVDEDTGVIMLIIEEWKNMSVPLMFLYQDIDGVATKGVYSVYSTDYKENIYVSSIVTETIHPIDPKYIPGAVLPVVELSTNIVSDTPVALTDSESARLDEVAALVTPINVIVSIAEGVVMSLPCYFVKSGEQLLFQSMMPQETNVYLLKQGETWLGMYGGM